MSIIAAGTPDLEAHPERFSPEALAAVLPSSLIAQALADSGVKDGLRRKLPAQCTTWLTLLLCLHRDRSYADLLRSVGMATASRGLWRGGAPPTTSALSRARDRVGETALHLIYKRSSASWMDETQGVDFHGLRLAAMDGTCFKVPDTPENAAYFGRPGSGRGGAAYPQGRLLALMDVGSRMMVQADFGSYRTAELPLARQIVGELPAGWLVLMDRNFVSYDLLWDIMQRGSEFLVRVKRHLKARVLQELGPGDRLVEIDVPKDWRPRRPDMPRTLTLRELRYTPCGGNEEIRLFTSLLDPVKFPTEELTSLYHERWTEETGIGDLKTTLSRMTTITRPTLLRSRKPERARQEIWALLTVYNAVRRTMVEASEHVAEAPEPARLGFTAALHQLRDGVRDMLGMASQRLLEYYRRMLCTIASAVVPLRPGRSYPRAVKIKMSGYPRKRAAPAA